VIPMQRNSNTVTYAVGTETCIDKMKKQAALPIFSDEACDFLDAVSKKLLQMPEAKEYADVITFAFWGRKASLQQLKRNYINDEIRIGRGIVFHISPSNVAVNFAYSLAAGLLAGNANIVRLPSKAFRQVDLICKAINEVLADSCYMESYVCLVRYGHSKDTNDYFSSICDTRVVWGGDHTIRTLRESLIKPRANEITFADRFSIAIIDADAYLACEEKSKLALDFYNDTYLNDQNACTSPSIVVWLGEQSEVAKMQFWRTLHEIVKERYSLQAVQAVDKLTALCLLGENGEGAKALTREDNYIFRVKLEGLQEELLKYRGNSGFFMEYIASDIAEITPICINQCQTISYYGVEQKKLEKFLLECRPLGIDRIVPIGTTLNFSLVWDGYDLIRSMSRQISVLPEVVKKIQ